MADMGKRRHGFSIQMKKGERKLRFGASPWFVSCSIRSPFPPTVDGEPDWLGDVGSDSGVMCLGLVVARDRVDAEALNAAAPKLKK